MMLPLLALAALAAPALAASECNGHAELCDRLYSNVTYVGTHNSYAVGNGMFDNQYKGIEDQLNDGIRALQVQAHNSDGTIHLCHTNCGFQDGGSFADYLGTVKSWMDKNPNDVVTLIIVNSDNLPATQFASAYTDSGMDKLSYSPPSASLTVTEWPTLGALIDAGTRLVTFMAGNADFAAAPYIIDEFASMWETAYGVTDQTFDCLVNRTNGDFASQMYMINHFLDVTATIGGTQIWAPATNKLNETNTATGTGSIGAQVDNCHSLWGRSPSIILLDFYDQAGSAPFDVAAQLNGVSAPAKDIVPANPASATGSATAGENTGKTEVNSQSINGAGRQGSHVPAAVAVALSAAGAAVALLL